MKPVGKTGSPNIANRVANELFESFALLPRSPTWALSNPS